MTDKKIEVIYEKHPVSAERKAELRAKGLKIIDARFNPDKTEKKADDVELTLEQLLKKCSNKDAVVKFAKDNFNLDLDDTLTRKELEKAINDEAEKKAE